MATICKRNGIRYIKYYYKGKRTQESLKTRSKEEAAKKLGE